jgi:hypothetical protein
VKAEDLAAATEANEARHRATALRTARANAELRLSTERLRLRLAAAEREVFVMGVRMPAAEPERRRF